MNVVDTKLARQAHEAAPAAKLSPTERAYRRCAIAFATVFFGGIGLIYAFLLVVDPWDTGRFPSPILPGVADIERRTATASRGRDPRFNAAIFGNSRTYSIDPARLSEATGYEFVSLGTPDAGPREEIQVTRYFLQHHPGARALLFATDERWCDHDPSVPMLNVFPFWLYRGDLEYMANVLSTRSFNAAQVRIKLAMGRVTPTVPNGYLDYEAGRVWNYHPADPPAALPPPAAPVEANTSFPGIEMFDGLLADLPREIRFVLLMPPLYYAALPRPGTQAAADLAACKAALAQRLGRQGMAFLDYQVDEPIYRDPHNFMDVKHQRNNVTRLIEDGIIGAFNGGAHAGP